MADDRENFIRNVSLNGDPVVYSRVHIWYQVWQKFGDKLRALESFSPYVRVTIDQNPTYLHRGEWVDVWGCRWIYPLESHDGLCIEHPISDWSNLKNYCPPDPDKFTDWEQARLNVQNAKLNGKVAWGWTDHGFVFLRLTYLRGFQNFMLDIAEERPELMQLIRVVENYWLEVVKRWINLGVDVINFGDDLGLQKSLPINPESWRRYIKPSYQRIFSFCRRNGVHVSLHSDGCIVSIIPDLIECGVSILNPQDLVNGLDNLANLAKGKVFIDLDIDRQNVMVFGSPGQIRSHISECIKKLGSSKGGLSLIWYVFPPTPLENIEVAVEAMHEYATYWCKGGQK